MAPPTGAVPTGVRADPPAGPITARLEALFPNFEALRVTAWRDQDWCRFLSYRRGTFAQSDDPSTCNLEGSGAKPFDAQASLDFDQVRALLRGAGGDIYIAKLEIDPDAGITKGEFDMPCARCDTRALVYQPGHDVVSDQDLEERMTRIDADWWMWETDVHPPG